MTFIQQELNWLSDLITLRLKTYFKHETGDIRTVLPPEAQGEDNSYARFIISHNLSFEDRAALALAFAPYLKPELMDCFCIKNSDTGLRFAEFGCVERTGGRILSPTLETVLFLLSAGDIESRLRLAAYFISNDLFTSHCLAKDPAVRDTEDFSSWILRPSEELLDQMVLDKPFRPHFSEDFPASLIKTARTWDDLILEESTMQQIKEILLWTKYGESVRREWNLQNKIKPGFKALFYGPPGSGKTFTATLLGQATGLDVYRIDLSMLVSKYIGETEKNLSKVFRLAEGKNWILFFDEADALFGKRTGVKDSHDKYANQETAYLLQRIEDYPGLIILSSNFRANLDDAFSRRFQSIIRFRMPSEEERLLLWKRSFSEKSTMDKDVSLEEIAADYELSGGSIINVVQYCSVLAYSRKENIIRKEDILEGIRREFLKEGKLA